MVKINTCVFISGKGSNLRRLILNSNNYNFPIKIKLVVSNDKNAEGLKLAKKWSIPYLILNKNQSLSENKTLIKLKMHKINLILLAGYMRILSKKFVRLFGKTIINIQHLRFGESSPLQRIKVLLDDEILFNCHQEPNKIHGIW